MAEAASDIPTKAQEVQTAKDVLAAAESALLDAKTALSLATNAEVEAKNKLQTKINELLALIQS